ncbi:MAG: DUF5686 and carboxypeptidase regulatory-like domain-containing protein, partial [Flammeovirgaceae bacterium]|nr:DUF5686 and carboxypeptidase regulatory-like domain-containing protein [Flammeovirgaceae bacterium]MDW8287993.1 DUF5686 family protein [Flammeovirgaceae bacterium]
MGKRVVISLSESTRWKIFFWQVAFLFSCAFSEGLAQTHCVSGKVTEYYSNEPLPFTHILVNDQNIHFFADINGNFNFCIDTTIFFLTFRTPQHKEKKIRIEQHTPQSIEVYLVANSVFERAEKTTPQAKALLENVVAYKTRHNPEYVGNFCYRSYNKLSLSTERSYIAKNNIIEKLEKAAKSLNWLVGKINYFSDEHHLFLMEAITERRYRTTNSQQETILASKVSGIEKPSVFVTTSLLQPFTLYNNTVYLAGSHYYSPFLRKSLSWYHFSIIDSAVVGSEKIYTVKFNPKSRHRVDFLQGYLYINAHQCALVHAIVTPSVRTKVAIEFLQTYQAMPHPKKETERLWFPKESISKIIKSKYSHTATKISAYNHTYYYDIHPYADMTRTDFDEILLNHLPNDSISQDFWEYHRKIPFTEKDRKTYQLYDTLGSLKQFERLVRLGEGFYYGHLPFGHINLDFHRFLDLNQHEGIRTGFGFHT